MASKTTFTDYELVRAIHIDNKEVLDYLFERNYAAIKRFVLGNGGTEQAANNALQRAIVELWYNINHQHFKPEKDLDTYLLNLVKDSLGNAKGRVDFYDSITNIGNKQYDLEVVSSCVGILEPQQRTLLCYHYFEGYDYARIATILNLSDKDFAEKKVADAKKQLQAHLKIRYPEIDRDKDLEKILSCGICAYRHKELMSFIRINAEVPKAERSINLVWVLIALIVVAIAGGVWYFTNNTSSGDGERKESVAVKKTDSSDVESSKSNPKDKDVKSQQNRINQSIKDIDSMDVSTLDTGKFMDEDIQIPKGKIQLINSKGDIVIKEIIDTISNGDIVVRKDELLYTMYCKVVEKSSPADTLSEEKLKELNASSANKTAELLNPQAKLPKEEQRIKVYQVELWKSPVNYKGYKMQKNKIIIYGIEDTELINLVSYDETIYLHSGPIFYMLIPSIDFRPFLRIKDKSILAELTK